MSKTIRFIGSGLIVAGFVAGFFVPVGAFAANVDDVVISEFNSTNGSEWVEIKNRTGGTIDLTGWTIENLTFSGSDITGTSSVSVGATSIPINGAVSVSVSGLNNPGDVITLYDESHTQINSVTYGAVTGYTATPGLETVPVGGEYAFLDSLGAWHVVSFDSQGVPNPDIKIDTTYYPSIIAAVTAATAGQTINVGTGTYEFSTQLNLSTPISIVGGGDVTFKAVNPSWSTVNGEKHLLGIFGGTSGDPITISNIFFDCNSQCYGVNTYNNAYGVLNNVTILNGKGAGLTVNGSTIVATDLDTSGNAWDIAVNVDPGSGVMTPSVFTLNGGTLSEGKQIWSDGANVSASSTVEVSAAGYVRYAVDGFPTASLWSNRTLANAASITSGSTTTIYTTLQAAIIAAQTGDTINIGSGTFTEVGQIHIDKNLTIVGDASNKAVIRPTGDFLGDSASGAWWLVDGGITFNLSNVVVDGNTSLINRGLRSHGNTTIQNVDFMNINGNAYQGMAVVSFGGTVPAGAGSDSHGGGGVAAQLTITNSTFSNIGRIGVLIKGTESTATLTGNTYTGKGDGTFLDYGFELGAGGSATISGNTITNNRGVAADSSTSAGILVTEYYGSGTSAVINNNTFSANSAGLHVGYLENDSSVVSAHQNDFSGETMGIRSVTTTTVVNATENWWGTFVAAEVEAKTSGAINFTLWCTNPAPGCTTFSTANTMLSFSFPSLSLDGVITGNEVMVNAPNGTDATALVPTIIVSTGATTTPASGQPHNFSTPSTFIVTSADGATQNYTVRVSVARAPVSGGGGGGATPAIPAVPGVSPAIPAIPPTPQVLGASTFNFGFNFSIGSNGNHVLELQKFLSAQGIYRGAINGYFGPLTRNAVMEYQRMKGIFVSGVVGPVTRASLNSSSVAGASLNTAQIQAEIQRIQTLVNQLLEQLRNL